MDGLELAGKGREAIVWRRRGFRLNRPAIRVVLAVLLVCAIVAAYVIHRHQAAIYRHQVAGLQADLQKLESARRHLAAHDNTLTKVDADFERVYDHANAAATKRRDSAISAHWNVQYETAQADIEKTDVDRLETFVATTINEHTAKGHVFSELYGDDAASAYRDCDAAEDEALSKAVEDWRTAISAIDDDDHIILNGGSYSDSVGATATNFYASETKEFKAWTRMLGTCNAAASALVRRLNADIREKRHKLAQLGVST